jgi:hypothetical protein
MSSLGRLVTFAVRRESTESEIFARTVLLEEAGSIMTHIGRWFMTGVEAGAHRAVFYFGATTPAGPEDETTPTGAAAAGWAHGKLNPDNFR